MGVIAWVLGRMIYPAATWYPGPADKQGYPGLAVNACDGVICHSMVGTADNALARLEGTDRASWCFSVTQTGKVLQHYESNAVTWHAGSMSWNGRVIGIEHEGGADPYDEPLTDAQRDASVALVHWLSSVHGFALIRDGDGKTLYEHHETGYPTACPSGRIPWDAYTEDVMTDQDKADIGAIVKINVATVLNEQDRPLTDRQKQDVAEIVKLQLEIAKQGK